MNEQKNSERKAVPFHGGRKCYACDERPVGLVERYYSGRRYYEVACERHADPTIRVFEACIYCSTRVRRGSLSIDGDFAHAACHREACS